MTSLLLNTRKTLLFNNNQPWQKKSGDPDFDVPMGCYDGAEVCELVGIYILNKLSNIIDIDSIGLYREMDLVFLKVYLDYKSIAKRKTSLKCLKCVVYQ